MSKPLLFAFMLTFFFRISFAQTEWNNYSTSWADRDKDSTPFLVTAIPYDGVYSLGGHTPLNITYNGSPFRYQSYLSDNFRKLFTYDSSDVYFFAPGIFRYNAVQYEYRILLNGTTPIVPWTGIGNFTADTFKLYTFKKGMALLGGYKTVWNNFLVAELRKKKSGKIISAAAVYWAQTKPSLRRIYTIKNLNKFLERVRKYDNNGDDRANLPAKLILHPGENMAVFELSANVYKREAIEYALIRNGTAIRNWQPNEYDNSFIWLKNLRPGHYLLKMRYRAQRQNVTTYPFEIEPAWYQTNLFKIIAGILIAGSAGFIALLFRLRRQRQITASEQAKKEKLHLELRSLRSQLNPHFIFNSLNSIQGLVNKNDIAGANRYLSEFGVLMRHSLAGSSKDYISLDEEITTLRIYLELEQLRFGFAYKITVGDGIDTSATEIPAFVLQPLVENAVKHGISGRPGEGAIHIIFSRKNNDMVAEITDSGNGFTAEKETKGHGLRLTRERTGLLNEILKDQHILLNICGKNDSGATVQLIFKNWLS